MTATVDVISSPSGVAPSTMIICIQGRGHRVDAGLQDRTGKMKPIAIDPRIFDAVHVDMRMTFVRNVLAVDECRRESKILWENLHSIAIYSVWKNQMCETWDWRRRINWQGPVIMFTLLRVHFGHVIRHGSTVVEI